MANNVYKNRRHGSKIKAFSSHQTLCLTESLVLQNPQTVIYKAPSIARLIKSLTLVSSCRAFSFKAFRLSKNAPDSGQKYRQ
jgi:hypothetical protein